jgi:hypothetical protein
MTIRRLLPIVIVAMLGWPGAPAAQAAGLDVSFYYTINQDGTGGLDANVSGSPVGQVPSVSWEACPPGGGCTPITPRTGFSPTVLTGTATHGTVYTATVSDGSQTVKATSLPWLGLVQSVRAPTIQGNLRAGGLITPVAGTWKGGWGNERSLLQIQVCRTSTALACVVVADGFYWDKCPGAGAVLTYNFVGQYVRVIDERIGAHAVFPPFGVGSPSALHPMEPGSTAAATVVGPIAAAAGPPDSGCGLPPPRVTIPKRAKRHGKRLEVGQVGCFQRCQVRVRFQTCKMKPGLGYCRALSPGERNVRIDFTRTFPGGPQSGLLLIPLRKMRQIVPGTYAVNVLSSALTALVRVPRSAVRAKASR